ncbi:MAG TPA: tRNA glutamyl-Q(34) synthetase GluQRS [Nocardia sp.]|uniref:tRNA glutamyl-Q(34) synthetase GluQRS n=1 Tax=Nocardia TaxID=1817 RepID=UPI002458726E|nr:MULTISPECIES: tRNA glutamyl-Q(34) synthetase GluQRS [Nocardia]HLS78021.1 tRNA glutamyl-Q(34) synthetase GluQRS [Nocardia sp.]
MTGVPTSESAGAGRYAPSPSGDLHLGNLRTALLAWLFARSTGRRFLLRVEDLDRVRPGARERQLADLAAIGLDWDGPVVCQSERIARYQAAIDRLSEQGRTYECFCTRREIQQAASAPHGPMGAYPGTCRDLTEAQRAARRAEGRSPALRLRARVHEFTIDDELHGRYTGQVDDVVLRRADGVPAYNLAVVVDDAEQGIDQVVRGDDLLPSTPRQAYLARLLGLPAPRYAHVPLVLNEHGQRLAKRDGSVTLADQLRLGVSAEEVTARLIASLGFPPASAADTLARFDPAILPRKPSIFTDDGLLRCCESP